ncbi:J domain-containing protein [Haloplanus rallus]|uniref:J domain-containing protein n=2 Tax=Haloplanus rallus TaxID=1816183 RepID=A0A6B9FDM5_9EURY|nr:J domain-containing protein [Haloplanus rallus]QGX94630.1 J domain-containing protein [Haloplanus rallus]
MPLEWVSLLPTWLVAGVAMGVAVALLIAGIFVAGDRLFPTPSPDRRRRIDGTDRRRAEIRTYLETVGERYVEDASVHAETVAFYLPERAVAITFDPQAYFAIDGTDTHAVLCEHEMPASALGRRLPFDVPEAGRRRSTAGGESVGAAFSRLGLQPTADAEEVRAAYRRRVKDVHPDQGGDSESFRRLREAYATAKEHAD